MASAGDGYPALGHEGTVAVRTDQPYGVPDRQSLLEPTGDRDELRQRLWRLPPGHPSSPVEADAGQARGADRRPLSDAEHAEHVKEVRALVEKARADGLATDRQHTIDPAREVWSDQRDALHDSIIDDLYGKATDVPCERRAIIAGGLPGAGKSTVLDRHAGIDRSQYLTINPDDIKEELARRGMIPPVTGLSPMEGSDLVHEESSHIAKRLSHRARADGKNLIWDITMSSCASTERRIDELRSSGYVRIEGVFVDIPVEISVSRADGRHQEGQDDYRAGDGLGGRFIPAEMIRAQADAKWGSRNRNTFEEVKERFDGWHLFDNSGPTPVLVQTDRGKGDHDH
jgi:predicted ABC-type ATPase